MGRMGRMGPMIMGQGDYGTCGMGLWDDETESPRTCPLPPAPCTLAPFRSLPAFFLGCDIAAFWEGGATYKGSSTARAFY